MNALVTINSRQIAVLELHIAGFCLRAPSARPARITLDPDRATLRTRGQATGMVVGLPRFMGFVDGFIIGRECPRDLVLREAVFEHGAGMIKDQRIGLAGS